MRKEINEALAIHMNVSSWKAQMGRESKPLAMTNLNSFTIDEMIQIAGRQQVLKYILEDVEAIESLVGESPYDLYLENDAALIEEITKHSSKIIEILEDLKGRWYPQRSTSPSSEAINNFYYEALTDLLRSVR